MSLKEAGALFLDILYPPRCMICGGIFSGRSEVCPKCREKIPYIRTGRCAKCGKPVEEGELLCEDCGKRPHRYREGFGAFLYDDVMKEVMAGFKYEGRRDYAVLLARLTFREARRKLALWRPDALIPVPLHKKRFLKRGYNQAELLAKELSNLTGIPVIPDLLIRKDNTDALKKLAAGERFLETAHAFALKRHPEGIRRALLVDDIYTTGATCDAAAAVLLEGGVEEVYFLTVCIGGGFLTGW